MSPSRGTALPTPSETPTDLKADIRSSSALSLARQNLLYLYSPTSASAAGSAPLRFRTRALLRTLRYIGIFIFWRIVRYAKYALVGGAIAAVGSTAIGSGVAFFVAPPTLLASVGVGLVWAMGKWGFRKMGVGEKMAEGVQREERRTVVDGAWGVEQGPQVVPW